ncbi:MAG TPA: hypothetical protein VK849_11545 [Longimicrobiales bacterium]|nr:hypothetical protein [Longimicrobiales bacterium]
MPSTPSSVPGRRRPVRFVLDVVRRAALRVPAFAMAGATALWASAALLSRDWSEAGRIAAFGEWSLTTLYTALGIAGGAVLGFLSGAAATVRRVEAEIVAVVEGMSAEGGSRFLPAVPLAALEANYARVLDATVAGTLGRLPLPGLVTRFVRARLRAPLVDDFLETMRRTGAETAGFTELRNWLLLRGLPYLTAPLHGPLRVWRLLVSGGLGFLFVLPLGVAALAGVAGAGRAVVAVFATAGAGVLVAGLRAGPRGRDPRRWRVGIVTLAVQLGAWPLLARALWTAAPVPALLLLGALALLGTKWSLDEAFVRAGPALPGPGPVGAAAPGSTR